MSSLAIGRLPQGADPGSPLWWLLTLERRLMLRQPQMRLFDRYYRGDHPLPFLTRAHEAKMRDEFRNLLNDSRSNFMRLIVDATEERLSVEGFRLSAESDPVADPASWDLWQANDMDATSQTAFLESLIKGVSYLSVWSDDDNDGYADINVEDPLQTYVAYVPGTNYRQRAAAIKIWLDDVNGVHRANVYLPDAIHKFIGAAEDLPPSQAAQEIAQTRITWEERELEMATNPLGVVPIIPLRNRPRLLVEGESEIEDVFRIQNQINALIFLQQLAAYFGAHRQRWAVGLTLMEDKNGKPIEPFNIAIDRLLHAEDPEVKFGEFSETNLKGYIDSIEQKVLHLAVTSRTPRHYLIQQGQSPSGDAIKSAEAGLVKKVERKQRTFGEGLEEAIQLARRFQGETNIPVDSEVVWASAQQRSEGVVTDAIVKLYEVGLITKATALEEVGFSQTKILQILQAPDDEFSPSRLDAALGQAVERQAVLSKTPRAR